MLKNKSSFYLSGLFLGILLFSVAVGFSISLYKQKGRVRDILKNIYLRLQKPNDVKIESGGADIDTDGEVKLYIDAQKEISKINPLLYGSNLSPQSETQPQIVDFVKSIGITCFRYPGGESPGYHWENGTFDFTGRYVNAPLRDIKYLIEFCQRTNAKLIMQVNIESGTPKEAAELVEYMNKKVGFPVEYWELGNEVYGDWDKAYTKGDKYAKLIKEYASQMKKIDPTIKIGADWAPQRNIFFNNALAKGAGNDIDFLSIHWYPNHIQANKKFENRIHPTAKEVMANYLWVPQIIAKAKATFAKYAPKKKDKLEFAFLEWDGAWDGLSYDLAPYTQEGIAQWSLANAIFTVDALGEFMRSSVSVSTQFNFQSTGFGLIRGWSADVDPSGQRWDGEIIRPKALAIKLFAKHFGDILIESKVENSPAYYKSQDWWPDSYTGHVPYITCYASKSQQNSKLYLMLINKHENKDYKVKVYLKGVKPKAEAALFILNGPSVMAQNEGHPTAVTIKNFKVQNMDNEFSYTIPAHSINAIEIEYEK